MKNNPFQKTRLAFATAIAGLALAFIATTVQAQITVSAPTNFSGRTAFIAANAYNSLGASKLVVVITGEHQNPGDYSGGVITTPAFTYKGLALTKAVERNPANPNQLAADIWYLDNPGTGAGTFSVTVGGNTAAPNYVFTVFTLSGTATGHGATATSNTKTVSLTTTAANSIVVASHGLGGDGNFGATSAVNATSPAVELTAITSTGSYVGHCVSTTNPVAAIGTASYAFTGGSATNGLATVAAEFKVLPPPTITGAATATAFTTTYGTASAAQNFTIGGTNLTVNLVATAPTGFEASNNGTTYGTTATFTQSGGTATGTLRIRLAATAAVTGTYDSQNIVLSSTGATSVNIVTAASGNAVTAKALTVTATGPKTYGTALTVGPSTANFTAVGAITGQTVTSVTLTPDAAGLSATTAAGTAYVVTPSAATGTGGFSAANYDITYTDFNGTVAQKVLTVTATGPTKIYGTALTAGPSATNFTAVGAISGETVDGVTLTPDAAGLSAATAAGTAYVVTPSDATGTGGFLISNYLITYANYNGTVAQKALTVTATGPTKKFGTALTAGPSATDFTADATGVGSEVVTSVTLTPNAAGLSASTPSGIAYVVTPSAATGTGGFLASNYLITYIAYNGRVANTLAWDIDGVTPGAGGTGSPIGTWATLGTTWSTDSTGSTATSPYTTLGSDDLAFSAGSDATGAYAITLGANQIAKSLTFEEGTATLSANTATLAGGGGITVLTGAGDPVVSSSLTITGANTFDVGAGRTLTLDGTTFSRGTSIRGVLNAQLGAGGALTSTMAGLKSADMVNGIVGPWASFGTGSSTQYATFSGNDIVGLTGTAAADATEVIDTTGTVNYDVAAVSALGAGASPNTLRYTGLAGSLTGNLITKGILNSSSAVGKLTISGTVTAGITAGAAGTSATEIVVNTANGDIDFTGLFTGAINKTGTGVMTLSGTPLHSLGFWTVNQGTLILNCALTPVTNNENIPGGIVNSGGTVKFGASNRVGNDKSFTISAGGTFDTNGFGDLIGLVTGAGNITNNGGGAPNLQVNPNGGSGTFSGVIADGTGVINFFVNGASGTQALTGLNTYTGITRVSQGVLQFNTIGNAVVGGPGVPSALGAPITVANGTIPLGTGTSNTAAVLNYVGTGNSTDRVIDLIATSGSGATITQSGASGLLIFTSPFTATGIGSKTLTLNGSTAGTGEIAGAIVNNTTTGTTRSTTATTGVNTLTLTSVDGLTAGNAISGTGIPALTTISSINTATKTVTMSAVATVAANATITSIGAVNLTSLTKSGTGTWTISGANTYSGDTNINAGKLVLSGGGTLANTRSITLATAAEFDVSTPTTALTLGVGQTLRASATGANTTGTITVASGKNLTLSAGGLAFTARGSGATAPLTVTGASAGALALNSAPVTVTTTTALAAGIYKLIAKSGSATVTGTPGTLTVAGSGIAVGTTASLQVISDELFLYVGTISFTGAPVAFTTTYGTASSAQSFSVSGSGLAANLVATAPIGFEVSSDGITYNPTATFTTTSGSASGTLSVRLTASASAAGVYDSLDVALTSTDATPVNITTTASGNIVSKKALSISPAPAIAARDYDGTNTAGAVTVGTLSGFVSPETVTVTGAAANYPSANVGSYSGTVVTYTLVDGTNGGLAANYSLANGTAIGVIDPKALSITAPTIADKPYDTTPTAGALTVGTLSGLVSPETLTVTGSAANYSGVIVGSYPGTVITYTLVDGTGLATNYSLANGAATGTIVKATPTATLAVTNSPVTFDGTPKSATVTVTVSSTPGAPDNILTGGAATQTAVGTYAVTANFVPTDTVNYNSLIGLSAGSLTIDPASGGYTTWATTNAPSSDPDEDFDGDGVSNAVEYILGGDKDTNDLSKLPTVEASGANLVFSFKRNQESISSTTVAIQVGTTLLTWPDSYSVGEDTAGSTAGVTVAQDVPVAGTDTITLTVAKGVDPSKFARLVVTPTP